jgi:hypothetical protein
MSELEIEPSSFVVQVNWSSGPILYGPFETNDEAMRWIVQNIGSRILFGIFPVFDRVTQ